jgi:hypothetical protein
MWTGGPEELPTKVLPKINSNKCLIWIIWSCMVIHSLLMVFSDIQDNSHFFCDDVLPDFKAHLTADSHRKTLKGYFLHLNNASAHNARISQQAIDDLKASRVPSRPILRTLRQVTHPCSDMSRTKLSG